MDHDIGASYALLETMTDEQLCTLCHSGNRMAEEILAGRYHRLVRSCARPYFLAGGDSEDLLQEGMFGLIKAMREYDESNGASFRTFAETCIRRRLYSVLRSAASEKHWPLNKAILYDPYDPSFFDANLSTAQGDPELELIGEGHSLFDHKRTGRPVLRGGNDPYLPNERIESNDWRLTLPIPDRAFNDGLFNLQPEDQNPGYEQ